MVSPELTAWLCREIPESVEDEEHQVKQALCGGLCLAVNWKAQRSDDPERFSDVAVQATASKVSESCASPVVYLATEDDEISVMICKLTAADVNLYELAIQLLEEASLGQSRVEFDFAFSRELFGLRFTSRGTPLGALPISPPEKVLTLDTDFLLAVWHEKYTDLQVSGATAAARAIPLFPWIGITGSAMANSDSDHEEITDLYDEESFENDASEEVQEGEVIHVFEIDENCFDELRLSPEVIAETQEVWFTFISLASSRDAAGQAPNASNEVRLQLRFQRQLVLTSISEKLDVAVLSAQLRWATETLHTTHDLKSSASCEGLMTRCFCWLLVISLSQCAAADCKAPDDSLEEESDDVVLLAMPQRPRPTRKVIPRSSESDATSLFQVDEVVVKEDADNVFLPKTWLLVTLLLVTLLLSLCAFQWSKEDGNRELRTLVGRLALKSAEDILSQFDSPPDPSLQKLGMTRIQGRSISLNRHHSDGVHQPPLAYHAACSDFAIELEGATPLQISVHGHDVSLFQMSRGRFYKEAAFSEVPEPWRGFALAHLIHGIDASCNAMSCVDLGTQGTLEFCESALLHGSRVTCVGEVVRDRNGDLSSCLKIQESLCCKCSKDQGLCPWRPVVEGVEAPRGVAEKRRAFPLQFATTSWESSTSSQLTGQVLISDDPQFLDNMLWRWMGGDLKTRNEEQMTRCSFQLPYAEERGHHLCEANLLILVLDTSAVIDSTSFTLLFSDEPLDFGQIMTEDAASKTLLNLWSVSLVNAFAEPVVKHTELLIPGFFIGFRQKILPALPNG
eukprot:g24839.t1